MSSVGTLLGMLSVGFALGMRHALETDHVAAVATLATRSGTVRHIVMQGIVWAIGHTLTLFCFGGVILAMNAVVPGRLAAALEFMVGIMLVVLGLDVFRRLINEKMHVHVHRHADGARHIHIHTHAADPAPHDAERHVHPHADRFPLRALLVGMTHGLAGTAALILIVAGSAQSLPLGLAYIAAFGIGSVLGMAALSLVVAIPLRMSRRLLSRSNYALQSIVALVSCDLGAAIMYESAFAGFFS